jgi:predicted TIM-barrel fold metal-dependent hydrolase
MVGKSRDNEVFDCHVHAWDAGAVLDPERRHTPTARHSGEDLAGVWKAYDIAGGVLVQPSFFGTDNSALLRLLAEDPSRRRGVVAVAPSIDPGVLQRWHDAGVRAIRFNTVSATPLPDLGTPEWQAILRTAAALEWHIEVTARAAAWPCLLPVLLRTDVRICVDHWGWPEAGDDAEAGWSALVEQMRTDDVWMKLSAPYRIGARNLNDRLSRLLDSGSFQHLLWGSDWPFLRHEDNTSYQRELIAAQELLWRAGIWSIVTGDNARRLYRFG